MPSQIDTVGVRRRIVPTKRLQERVRKDNPVDTAGMDPQMAETVGEDTMRRGVVARATRPATFVADSVRVKPGPKSVPSPKPTVAPQRTILGGTPISPTAAAKADSMYNELLKGLKKGKK